MKENTLVPLFTTDFRGRVERQTLVPLFPTDFRGQVGQQIKNNQKYIGATFSDRFQRSGRVTKKDISYSKINVNENKGIVSFIYLARR